jgi:hypothetical protein
MNLELQLTEWKRATRVDVRPDESGERFEFPSFDINLEDIDVVMA